MSHFFGYMLKRNDIAPEHHTKARMCSLSFLARSGSDIVEHQFSNVFWVVTLKIANARGEESLRSCPNMCSILAGDLVTPDIVSSNVILNSDSDALKKCSGHFALASYDSSSQTLILATDPLGVRGMYYVDLKSCIAFSTSFELLKEYLAFDAHVDRKGLAEKIFFGFNLSDRTTVSGIKRLVPSHRAVFRQNEMVIEQYIDYYNQPIKNDSFQNHINEVKKAFTNSVKRRRVSKREECFLSGGMDSRAIVAELFSQGAELKTFCSGYKNSSDHILSDMVSKIFNTDHYFHERTPAERVFHEQDPFAIYARDHFPNSSANIRSIWSGDGGGLIGNIALNESKILLCSGHFDVESAVSLYPKLKKNFTKLFTSEEITELSQLAIDSLIEEFSKLGKVPPENRFRVFYLKNHQPRHLSQHYELIDLHKTELVLPFFDVELVKAVLQVPPEYLLRHRFYNVWLGAVSDLAKSIYWQSYPGHDTCPLARPGLIKDQWDKEWYSSREVNQAYFKISMSLLRSNLFPYRPRTKMVVVLASIFALLGTEKMRHDIILIRSLRTLASIMY